MRKHKQIEVSSRGKNSRTLENIAKFRIPKYNPDAEEPKQTDEPVSFLKVKTMNQTLQAAKLKPKMLKLFGDLWRRGQTCILFATDGVGKTCLSMQIAEALARGESVSSDFINEVDAPLKVLYCDFEISDVQHLARYTIPDTDIAYQFSENLIRCEFDFGNPESLPNNTEKVIVAEISKLAKYHKSDVIIIDNLTALIIDSEKANTAGLLMKPLLRLKI